MLKKSWQLMWVALVIAPAPAVFADDDEYEEPDEDWVWEDGDVLEDGATSEGFYRPRERAGYVWVEGGYQNGVWVPGDYRPVAAVPAMVWEPGFRGEDGYFVGGFWRPAARTDYVWVAATRGPGGRHGHWRPVTLRGVAVWVDGYWTPEGVWVDGTWRERARPDYAWVPGHWRWGRWIPGHWKATGKKPGHTWVVGAWGPNGWVDGYWRPGRRAGHHWRGGHWRGGLWVPGEWVTGRRVARVHARPKPVKVMVVARGKHVHHWKEGKRHHGVHHHHPKPHKHHKPKHHH